MNDLISRQAAIDALNEKKIDKPLHCDRWVISDCLNVIASLPSAEPERRDCGWTGIDNDYPVSVREVIDITAETGALVTQGRIRELKPYKMLGRPTGHWMLHENQRQEDIDNSNYLYICSECGKPDLHAKTQKVPFCWWCGANMEETV